MKRRKCLIFMSLLLAVVVLSWGIDQGWAQQAKGNDPKLHYKGKPTQAEKKAAASRFNALYDAALVGGTVTPLALNPGGVPHYFGPDANWAYSPLPRGPVAVITLTSGGAG